MINDLNKTHKSLYNTDAFTLMKRLGLCSYYILHMTTLLVLHEAAKRLRRLPFSSQFIKPLTRCSFRDHVTIMIKNSQFGKLKRKEFLKNSAHYM